VFAAVQRLPVQHAWLAPPQVPHEPLLHMPSVPPQELPPATH
jgi:hypothetical protein